MLATFVVVPVRWIDAFGWRPLSWHERHAAYAYYREVGRRMGITDLPGSYAETADLLDAYEERHMRFTAGQPAHRRGHPRAVRRNGWPRCPRRWCAPGCSALLDDTMLAAFGFRVPAPAAAAAGPRRPAGPGPAGPRSCPSAGEPVRGSDNPFLRSYPDGYDVERLGTHLP